jgi:hypothetical protein
MSCIERMIRVSLLVIIIKAGPVWVSQRHQSMSASATAFAESGHRGPRMRA